MTIQFYLAELNRLLEENDVPFALFKPTLNDLPPSRWLPCPTCRNQCFRAVTRTDPPKAAICMTCKESVKRRVLHWCVRQIQRHLVEEQKERVHQELVEYCHHPDYVLKTGSIETFHLFAEE